ncbi:MAG TPA: class I SAM-dependent methyltransferase [Thermoplasmata archaeon]|nr:class I SAM-dependent methyltransferase [Thermoplasmata archaeon]
MSGTSSARPMMFYRLADQYDALVSAKDSRREARYLDSLAVRFGRSGGRSWLDVACGTGRHLEFLRRSHDVAGLDLSRPMLRIARRRLPGTRLYHADMRSFRLDERFDVVSCLFSAIGHLRSGEEVGAAFRTFAAHVKPGGVVIVEPWIDPKDFRAGFVQLVGHSEPTRAVARMAFSSRRGRHSIVRFEYLVADARRGVRHFAEDDVGLLVSHARLLGLMERAGLHARFLAQGLTPGRGLLVGQRPGVPVRRPAHPRR